MSTIHIGNIKNTDHAEFEREAIPHRDALYYFAYKMTGDSDAAEDLVQETYLKAFRFFDKFEKGTNCKAWLFRILKNTYINEYRRESKIQTKVDYEDIENFYENIKPGEIKSSHIQNDAFSGMPGDEVTEALAELPEDFRTIVILSDLEDYSYEEIADFVDCPIGTVRSRLHRARKLLQAKLGGYAQKNGYAMN